MTSSQKLFARNGLLVAGAFLLLSGVGYVFSAPTAPPPGTSIPLPLTRGSAAETKAGPLTVQGGLTVTGGQGICLGGTAAGQCKTAWPNNSQVNSVTLTGSQNLNCDRYGGTSQYIEVYYGSPAQSNSGSGFNICSKLFSITTAAIPGTPVGVLSPTVKCWRANSSYTKASDWASAIDVQITFNALNQAVVTGTCQVQRSGSSSSSQYYGVAELSGTSVRYLGN
ncbi:MAG: hypothetical protein HY461_00235 [Parcubacteria group bacterium]|nr:hypothetical protein [Parcubacteria group bacterium]